SVTHAANAPPSRYRVDLRLMRDPERPSAGKDRARLPLGFGRKLAVAIQAIGVRELLGLESVEHRRNEPRAAHVAAVRRARREMLRLEPSTRHARYKPRPNVGLIGGQLCQWWRSSLNARRYAGNREGSGGLAASLTH